MRANKIEIPIRLLDIYSTNDVRDWIDNSDFKDIIYNNGGVYFLINTKNSKVYVGSTYNFYYRIFDLCSKGHRALVTRNKHWIITKETLYDFRLILKPFSEDKRLVAERRYVRYLKSYKEEYGYNKTSTGRYGGGLTRDRYYVTDGVNDKLIRNSEPIPEGFVKGRSNGISGWNEAGAEATEGTHCITNGTIITKTEKYSFKLPEGFYPGKNKSIPTKKFIDLVDPSIFERNKFLDTLDYIELNVEYSLLESIWDTIWYVLPTVAGQLYYFYKVKLIVKEFINNEKKTYWITKPGKDGKSLMFSSRSLPSGYWPGKFGRSFSYEYLDNIGKLYLRERNDLIYDDLEELVITDTIPRLKSLGYYNTTSRDRLSRQLRQFFNIKLDIKPL